MKRLFGHSFAILATISLLVSNSQAMGFFPPPPPPSKFSVVLGNGTAYAQFAPQNAYMRFVMDGTVSMVGYGESGSLSLMSPVDPTKPHIFTMTAIFAGLTSPAVQFSYTPPAPVSCHEEVVNVKIENQSHDQVIGFLWGGGSSGFSVNPHQDNVVSLWSTGNAIHMELQAYLSGPTTQFYHNISVRCAGRYNYSANCGSSEYDSTRPPVATAMIVETSSGTFTCSITSAR